MPEIAPKRVLLFFAILVVVQIIFHFSIFSRDLVGFHVWRQTQTQNTTLSFAQEDFNILNPRKNERGNGDGIFRMEFPLAQWITSIPIRFFGHPVIISRGMNFLFTLLSTLGIFRLILVFAPRKWLAVVGAFLFSFSPIVYYYQINPIPDNLALCFAIWGMYHFARFWKHSGNSAPVYFSLICFGFAALVKLPFVLYYSLWAAVLLFSRSVKNYRFHIVGGTFLSLVPIVAWYWWVIPHWTGNGIVQGIFKMTASQKSEYWNYVWFHLRSTLPELLIGWPLVPFFVFGLVGGVKSIRRRLRGGFPYLVLAILLAGYLLFEMNMIERVHDYYFFPLLPLLILVIVQGISWLIGLRLQKVFVALSVFLLIAVPPVNAYLRIQSRWDRVGFNEDLLTFRDELRDAVPEQSLVCVGNDPSHHIFLYYVQKMGWVFENNWINEYQLQEMIQKGCRYLYSDSRAIDQNPKIRELIGTKVAEYGSVKVFELKCQD